MSIIFILILISAMSSFVVLVNDQLAHSYDIVYQIEKSLKLFYEMEFVVYSVFDFYKEYQAEIELPSSRILDLYFSPKRKKITNLVEFVNYENGILIKIAINPHVHNDAVTLVNCYLDRNDNDSVVLKSYQIEKRGR